MLNETILLELDCTTPEACAALTLASPHTECSTWSLAALIDFLAAVLAERSSDICFGLQVESLPRAADVELLRVTASEDAVTFRLVYTERGCAGVWLRCLSTKRLAKGQPPAPAALDAFRPLLAPDAAPDVTAAYTLHPSILAQLLADSWHPLSSSQRGLWIAYKLNPESRGDFNIALAMRTRPAIEPERLRRALGICAARHPMLRARFRERQGEPMQSIHRDAVVPLHVLSVESLDDGAVAASVKAGRLRPIDLERQPPFEANLYHVGDRECVIFMVFDHLVCDGWSLYVLLEELGEILERGAEVIEPTRHVDFFDFVSHEQLWLHSKRADKQREYWREALANANPSLELPADVRRRLDRTGESRSNLEVVLPADLSGALRELAAKQSTSLFVTLLVAYAVLLQRLSNQAEVSIGSALPTRGDPWKRTFANLVNRVVIPIASANGKTVAALMRDTHARCMRTLKNKDYPFEAMPRNTAQPAFRATYVFQKMRHASDITGIIAQSSAAGAGRWAGYDVFAFGEHLHTGGTGLELTLEPVEIGDRIFTEWGFDEQTFTRATIERFARSWLVLLRGMTADPTRPVAELPWLTDEDRELLRTCNATAVTLDRERCAHELIEEHAARDPNALALRYEDECLTYGDLNARANRLAAYLRSLGVVPDSRVGVCAERGIDLVVAFVATLKAGGAYVPLDPGYPAERLQHMLQDSAPVVVLADGSGRSVVRELAEDRIVVDLQADSARWAQASSADASPRQLGLRSSHLAYVIYTSGSTGVPKGVLNEHRGLCNLVATQIRQFGGSKTKRVLQFSSASFDASIWEIAMALGSGASLHLAPRAALMPGRALLDTFARHGITHVTLPPSALAVCDLPGVPFTPSTVIVAGEAISCSEANKWASRVTLYNAYGPTETTVCATMHRCLPGVQVVPLGRPIDNARIYVLDANRRPVPVGVPGEIYVAGVPVGRGYLNLPERNQECFLPDPFAGASEAARMYKTGDLGRWRSDGTLEYLGRNDSQIKLRGFRIELGEVEARLSQIEGISNVVVALREDVPGDKRLVAYYSGARAAAPAPAIEVVRAHAAAVLPEQMVPSAYVRLEALPLTPNGKIDRRALPAPEQTAYVAQHFEEPRGDVERTLARLWAELFQRDRVGRADNFFELGGSSLTAVSFLERARGCGLQVDARALFATPVLAELAESVSAVGDEASIPVNAIPTFASRITPEMLPLVRLDQVAIDRIVGMIPGGAGNVQDIYPLTPLQQGMLFHHVLQAEGDAYVFPILLELDCRARLDRCLEAVARVVERHDVLRTAIVWRGLDAPVQVVQRRAAVAAEPFELSAGEDVLAQLKARFDPRQHRIDVQQAPLLRAHVTFDPASARWLLVLVLHHLAGDHTTLELLLEEVRAVERGLPSQLPQPIPFRNFVARMQASAARDEHAGFFSELLGDVTEPTAPFGLVETRAFERLERAERTLLVADERRLRETARALGVSIASVVHLAWALVLARASNRTDVVFGTVLSGRMQAGPAADRGFGPFINTLPVRLQLTDCHVAAALQRVQILLATLLQHEHAPLTVAQQASQLSAQVPLFAALLNYRRSQTACDPELAHTRKLPELLWNEGLTNYPLSLAVDDSSEAFRFSVQAPPAVGAERVCEMVETTIAELVAAIERSPHGKTTSVLRLQVLPEHERQRLLAHWNATGAPFPRDRCVHELVEAQAERAPTAIALRFGAPAQELSYGELNQRANRLAHHLRSLGVGPERVVAICAERGFELIIAMLATWKAAGAYVVLDPAYPKLRLEYMLRDSSPIVLLEDCADPLAPPAPPAHSWAGGFRVLHLRRDVEQWADAPSTDVAPTAIGLSARNLAYVVYTSGSTGTPKGVMIEHRSLCNMIAAQVALFGVSASSRVLQFASPSFDASVSEVGMALASGASLHLAQRAELMPGDPLLRTLARDEITHVTLPPSALEACDSQELPFAAGTVIVAGEAISASAASKWASRLTLWNAYGPSETAVCATANRCDPGAEVVSIGRPIANTRIYILSPQGEPVPVGVIGELHIGGVPVGRGYLNRPDWTAERFVLDPFSVDGERRMYKTGDFGRFRADGSIEYVGRTDAQVKLRGFRIELGEIEARLSARDGIAEVAVLAREDASGEKQLVAYYTGRRAPSNETLRTHARASLPDHMVPAAYVYLPAFPRTPNGKIDRKALPRPNQAAYISATYVRPQGALEETLERIWKQVLGLERVGRNDNFFDLGGHSLLAVQLVDRVQRQLGVEIALGELYARPKFAQFASVVGRTKRDRKPLSNLVPLRPVGALRPLFCVHALDGTVDYVRRLATRLDSRVPLYGFEASGWGADESLDASLVAFAERYIAAMRAVQPRGPYRLLGYSAGGLIAYAMAEALLRDHGETIEFLGLVDTRPDLGLMPSAIEAVEQGDRIEAEHGRKRGDAAYLYHLLKNEIAEPARADVREGLGSGDLDSVLGKLQRHTLSLCPHLGVSDASTLQRAIRVMRSTQRAVCHYRPSALPIPVTLFAANEITNSADATGGWGALLSEQLRTVPIGGTHFSIVESPYVDVLARTLGQVLPQERHASSG